MANEDQVIVLLEELVAWTRFSARDALEATLRKTLSDPKHLKAYDLSDGSRSQTEIADASGLSQPTVSLLWQKWRRLGIVRDHEGRARHLVKPSDLGVDMPKGS